MKNVLLFFLLSVLFVCCKNKNTGSDEEVSMEDFIGYFPDTKLPYQMADSTIDRKQADTSVITYKMFTGFVPDTVFSKQFGKKVKPRFYPLGKVAVKKGETYLFLKAVAPSKRAGYILVFDKDKKFIVSKPLVIPDNNASISQRAEMDTRYTITTMRERKVANELLYQKNAYVFNSEGVFTLILTESNDMSKVSNEVYNPIDTFARKNKYSGDYVLDAKNFVSVRDGKTPGSMLFFVHFEKDKGACSGELKGEAVFSGASKAVFRQSSGPCMIDFSFTATRVSMKETGACGTYRDIKCFFEGSFPKKKAPKAKKATKK